MLANLATALFEHGRIRTTHTKARRLRPLAEHLITFAKRGDLHAKRQVMTVVRDRDVVATLFDEIGPRFAARPGGYTRIVKLGPRKGDNAPMALIELVEGQTPAAEVVDEAERARATRFRRRRAPTGATAEAARDLAAESETAAAVAEEAAAADVVETPDVGDQQVPLPTEGDVEEAQAPQAEAQVAVPTEGGDTEVVTESAGAIRAPSDEAAEGEKPEEPET